MHHSRSLLFSKTTFVSFQQLIFGQRGVCCIPHPQKAYRGGEDAFFSHPYGISVADGVGGYSEQGVDPAVYTRNVMSFSLEKVKANVCESGTASALDVLNYGWKMANTAAQPGGCPVTMATIVEHTFASILNLGDCGIIVLRKKKLLYQTTTQQHSFNCPYQLPHDPPDLGEEAKIQLREGDVFLCMSDGVLDNIEVDDLIKHLDNVEQSGCKQVAEAIGKHASLNGHNREFLSPFARHASQLGYRYMGGKLDDITALVARVTPATSSGLIKENSRCAELIEELLPLSGSSS
ncbi:unnamed protein product [Phytomonas sp. EM1]|nr:unnamed protein product [Phytomonas sp. EM1]|eukprot:CCW60536.1 unnamed protein product [Phytomonas sp. isolate EM1]